MDSLTHLAAGALTPLAFRGTPKRSAVIGFGIAIGELPDIDVFFGRGTEALLALHRGITHALFWQPVLVLAVVVPFFIWLNWQRPGRTAPATSDPGALSATPHVSSASHPGMREFTFGRMYLLALFASLTHIYLDCMTTFGTRILLPFSDIRIGFPAMFIVDICLTLPALGLLVYALRQPPDSTPLSARLPRQGFTACGTVPYTSGTMSEYAVVSKKTRLAARISLAWILLYPLASLSINAVASEHFKGLPLSSQARQTDVAVARVRENIAPAFAEPRLILMPEPFAPILWKVIVDEGKTFRIRTISLLSLGKKRLDRVFAKPEPQLYEALKRQNRLFEFFEAFAPLMIQTQRPASALVQASSDQPVSEYSFMDLRYVASPDSPAGWVGRDDPVFVLEARVNASRGLLAYRFLQRGKNLDTKWTFVE